MKNTNYKLLLGFLLLFLGSAIAAQNFTKKNVNIAEWKSKGLEEAPKKIYLKNFKVFYQMIAEGEKTVYGGRQLGGGSYTGDATARLAVGVTGVNPDDLQTLTNQLYQDYIADLEALGIEVLTSKDIPDIEFFEEWELIEGPSINQEQIQGSLMVIPDGFSYFVKGMKKSGKEKTGGFMSGVTGDAGNFGSGASGPVPRISEQLNDIVVAEVVLNIPSIYIKTIKGVLGSSAKVKGGAYLRLQSGRVLYAAGRYRQIGVTSPANYFEMTVTDPVLITGVFGEQEFKSVATKSRTTVPSYASFFTVDNTSVALTNTIECKADDYISNVKRIAGEYLSTSVELLESAMSGEKVKKLD
jgi:hypothetical protein